nr:MAG TPA: hypothetical protein [Caudoviricetes sp.]
MDDAIARYGYEMSLKNRVPVSPLFHPFEL